MFRRTADADSGPRLSKKRVTPDLLAPSSLIFSAKNAVAPSVSPWTTAEQFATGYSESQPLAKSAESMRECEDTREFKELRRFAENRASLHGDK